jgi:hypothetical protein
VCAVAAVASAQTNEAAAIKLFDEGRAQLKAGNFVEACAAFEKSQQLDPANGTLYNLAGCYVKLNKLASAWTAYRTLGDTDSNEQRRADSLAQAKALEPRLPKLVITVAGERPSDLRVDLDARDITSALNVDSPVDLGNHTLTAHATGYADWTQKVDITVEGKTKAVEIQLVKQDTPPTDPVTPVTPVAPVTPTPVDTGPPFSPKVGLIVSGVGVAALATGVVFGLVARGRYNDAQLLCGEEDQLCNPADVDPANASVDSARSAATISTITVVGGAALVGAGIGMYLYARSTESAVQVTPGGGGSALGVTLGGSF